MYMFRIRCSGLPFWNADPYVFVWRVMQKLKKSSGLKGRFKVFLWSSVPRDVSMLDRTDKSRVLHCMDCRSFGRVIYINSCLDSSAWAILDYELCRYIKMETFPQNLQLTSFRTYNDRVYELRQFDIVHSLLYSSVFTISSNECTQLAFNSQ